MSQLAYLDGKLIPRSQTEISVMDYGFLFGFGLFETMRAYGGRIFRLESHRQRLLRSADILGLSVKAGELGNAATDTIQANKLGDARVRLMVSAGQGTMTPDQSSCSRPTVLVLAESYQPYPDEMYRKGFKAIMSPIRRNSQSPLSKLKSTSYLEGMLARQQARTAGADEAICLNEKGLLAEASMSNIFLVKQGVLITPGRESGILAGITRQIVLEIASNLGIELHEREVMPEELYDSQEALLTSSLIEVMPLTRIKEGPVASGEPGPITRRLIAAYRELVLSELEYV
jgi:branched-chain amino acid aminotransferase